MPLFPGVEYYCTIGAEPDSDFIEATENASTEIVSTGHGGQWGTQVRKTQIRYQRGGKRKYGKFKQESAGVDVLLFVSNAST